MIEAKALPLYLRGRYQKTILVDGDESFLFKDYSREGDGLSRLAEIASSLIYAKFDPMHTVSVEDFVWEGNEGTLQPLLRGFEPVCLTTACESIIDLIRQRQVFDWVLSNHDNHWRHVLVSESRLKFVDYGQSFKYFPNDELSASYYPNREAGQAPPVYCLLPYVPGIPAEVEDAISRVRDAGADEILAAFEPYLYEKYRCDHSGRALFEDSLRLRIDTLMEKFEKLYRE